MAHVPQPTHDRYLTPDEARLLLTLIAERMTIDDQDELARKRWAKKVRKHWPGESYSGSFEQSVGDMLQAKGFQGF